MPDGNDFEFKGTFDASDIVSGFDEAKDAADGLTDKLKDTQQQTGDLGLSLVEQFRNAASAIQTASEQISKSFAEQANNSGRSLRQVRGESDSVLASLARFAGVGSLVGAGAFGLEHLVDEAREGRKSIEDYRIALLQATGDQGKANIAFADGEHVIEALSGRFRKTDDEIRATMTSIAGLSGAVGGRAQEIAEVGIAFEQLGVPAKALNAILRGAADPDSLGAIESLKAKFPALAGAIDAAATPAEKLDAILKAVQPTLKGMEDAADGPLGKFDQFKIATGELKEALGNVVSEGTQPFLPAMGALGEVLNGSVTPAISDITKFLGENNQAIQIAAGGYQLLKGAMAIKEAGGLASFLNKQTAGLLDTAKSIVTKYIPGLAVKTAAETATGAASTAAGVAAQGFGRSILVALGPIGLIIAGVTAAAAAIAIFSGTTKDIGEATEEFKDAQADVDAAMANKQGVTEKSASLNALSAQYDALAGKPARTAEEEKQFADITAQLAREVPNATEKIAELDENGVRVGKTMVVNTDAIRALNTEQDKLAKSRADEALKRQEEKAKQLAASYVKAKEEQGEFREDLAALEAAQKAGFTDAKVADGFLGLGSRDVGETLDLLDEVNGKIEEAEPALQGAIAAEIKRGLTVDQVAQKYKLPINLVKELSGEIEKADQATKNHVRSAAELADEYKKTKDANDKLVTQGVDALTQLSLQREELAARAKEGDLAAQAELDSTKAIFEETKKAVGAQKEEVTVRERIQRQLGLIKGKIVDLIAVEEALQKIKKTQVEVDQLRLDKGILTEKSKKRIREEEVRGLNAVRDKINKELEGKSITDAVLRSNERIRQLVQKRADIEKQIETIQEGQLDKAKKLEEAYRIITQKNVEAGITFLNAIAGSITGFNQFDAKLRAIDKQIEFTSGMVDRFVTEDFAKRPNVSPIVDEVNKIVEAVRNGADPGNFIVDLEQQVRDLNKTLKDEGVEPDQLVKIDDVLKLINDEASARISKAQTTKEKLISIEQERVGKIGETFGALNILIGASGLRQTDQLRLRIEAEKEMYEQLKQAARDANDTEALKKLDADYIKSKIASYNDLGRAMLESTKQNQEKIRSVFESGFSAAFGVLNKEFFEKVDTELNAQKNAFGAFASGIIKGIVQIGQQSLANIVSTQLALLATTASTTAAMQVIAEAAAPAAFSASVATFGGATGAGLASLISGFASFKALLKVPGLAEGTVIGMPTLAMIGERFDDELVTPLKTAREVLKEEIAGVKAGMPSLTREDMQAAFTNALVAVPPRMVRRGYETYVEYNLADSRLRRRGARRR